MIVVFTLIFAAIFLLILRSWLKWTEEDSKIGISCPPVLPVIGNLLEFWKPIRNNKEYLKFAEYVKKYGDTFRIRLGPKLIICTRDVKVIEVIANDPKFVKSDEYKFFKVWWGEGLVLRNGENWFKFRRLITSAFHFQILERFIPIFEEQTNILINILHKKASKEAIDVTPLLHAFSLDIITETAMGLKLNSQLNGHSEFVNCTKEIAKMIYKRIFNPFLMQEWIWRFFGYYKRLNILLHYYHGFVNDIIEKRRDIILKSEVNTTNIDSKERPVFLDLLLKSEMDGKPLSNEDIRSETKTFMFAGHETTASTLGFVLYCLAKHQDVQQKLYEEIKEKSSFGITLSIKSINEYQYLDCVIRETLRLFPITAINLRKRTEDLKIGDLYIPKDVSVMFLLLASHLNEKYFENPDKFIPERFSGDVDANTRNPYAYQPFAAGLRNCIGQRFAVLELKTATIKILSEFDIHLPYAEFEVDLIQSNTFTSKTGVPLRFKQREY